jgi:hypothetical protein
MKTVFLLMVCFLLAGCTTLQIKDDSEINPLAVIAARRIAHNAAIKDPDKVEYLKEKTDEILSAKIEDAKPLLLEAIRYASAHYTGDPMLAEDIISLAGLFRVDLTAPDIDWDIGELRTFYALVRAFRTGLG